MLAQTVDDEQRCLGLAIRQPALMVDADISNALEKAFFVPHCDLTSARYLLTHCTAETRFLQETEFLSRITQWITKFGDDG